MSEIEQGNKELKSEQSADGVDQTRRRLAGAAVGSGVILTLKSHPVLATGGTNECTKSALLSGNLSNHQSNVQCGCSPGYWGQHPEVWDKLTDHRFLPSMKFNTVFGCTVFNSNTTLLDIAVMQNQSATVLQSSACCSGSSSGTGFTSKVQTCSFHAVAAICNAATFAWRYLPNYDTPEKIITAYQNAYTAAKTYKDCASAFNQLKTDLDKYNTLYCGYDAHGNYQS
ncbi:MAG: hypothetical protein IV108_06225 [Burkholderiales bacterium]|nr:hypothetical protein [Burkholderiales bacterium]